MSKKNKLIPQKLFTLPIFLSVPGPTYVYIIPDRPEIRVWAVVRTAPLPYEQGGDCDGNCPRRIEFYSTPANNFYTPQEYKPLRDVYLFDDQHGYSGAPDWNDVERIKWEILQELFPPIVNPDTKRYFTRRREHYHNSVDIYVVSNTKDYLNELKQYFPGVTFDPPQPYELCISLSMTEDCDNCFMHCGSLIEINAPTAFYLEQTFKAKLLNLPK